MMSAGCVRAGRRAYPRRQRTMRRINVLVCTVVLFIAASASAQWRTMTIDNTYPDWYENGHTTPDQQVHDVLQFTKWNGTIRDTSEAQWEDQIIANPHVVKNDAGEWIIVGY